MSKFRVIKKKQVFFQKLILVALNELTKRENTISYKELNYLVRKKI